MTGIELAREYFPSATDDEADALMWTCTCFPFLGGDDAAIVRYREQLKDYAMRSSANICTALALADGDISREMDAIKKEARGEGGD